MVQTDMRFHFGLHEAIIGQNCAFLHYIETAKPPEERGGFQWAPVSGHRSRARPTPVVPELKIHEHTFPEGHGDLRGPGPASRLDPRWHNALRRLDLDGWVGRQDLHREESRLVEVSFLFETSPRFNLKHVSL